MKTIKEMAEKYVEERRDLDVGHANAQFNCFNMIDAVKFGANYVLDHLSKTIVVSEDGYLRDNLLRDNLRKMIELLKGE